ncbi:GNAT family N-acetyltransferase [Streptomyces sp. NPDC048290]|uniref:GNAT family N-acetyltransferase n=1 Tax=Streptomyces sp. NPDC048290 TaxID=3155811 RepID=UPI003436DC68
MKGIGVRPAGVGDARALAELRWHAKREEAGADPVGEDFAARCEEWLRARLTAGTWRAWLAETAEGRVCGQVFLGLVEKVPDPDPGAPAALGYVTAFYVVPELRGRGIGGALLAEVERHAHDAGLDTLVVWPSRRSTPLYRRSGYTDPAELLERPVAPQ